MIWYIPRLSSENEADLSVPQLGVMFLADYNSWGVNGTPYFETEAYAQKYWVRWVLAMFLHSPAYFYLVIKNQISRKQILLFARLWQLGRGKYNVQHLNICREKVCRIKVLRTYLGKYGQNIFCTPKKLPAPPETSASSLAAVDV